MRANDFLDLLLLVRQRAALPALTTRPEPFPLLVPKLDVKSNPSDKPEMEEGGERREGEERKEQWRSGERAVEQVRVRFKESEDGFGAVRMREAEGVGAVMAMQSDNEAIIHF